MSSILQDLKAIIKSRYFFILSVCLAVFLVFSLAAIGSIFIRQDVPFLETFYIISAEIITKPLLAFLQVLACVLALWRACFHPVAHSSYHTWLATTP